MTKMSMFILCTLFALTWSRPSEQQDDKSNDKNNDTDDPYRIHWDGSSEYVCPNIRQYADPDNTGVTRFRFCWDDPSWEADKRMSENAARAWERAAKLSFEFLDNCNNRDADVTRIYIRDLRPFVVPYLEDCKFKATQMVLNFEFSPMSGYGGCTASTETRNNCIKLIAMNQMGYAIGFRSNSTCNTGRNFGIYSMENDPDSIMDCSNYAAWSNPQLSQGDIEAARGVFGQR